MASIQSLCKFIHSELPGCPKLLVDQNLKQAVIEFCRSSLAWQIKKKPIRITEGKKKYRISTDSPDIAFERLIILSLGQDRNNRQSSYRLTEGRDYIMFDKCEFELCREPTANDNGFLFMTIAVKPSMDSDFIDDQLLEDWFTHMVLGAKSYLMKMPRKSWSNPGQAQDYKREFWEGIKMAEAEWRKRYSQKTLVNKWLPRERGNPFVI